MSVTTVRESLPSFEPDLTIGGAAALEVGVCLSAARLAVSMGGDSSPVQPPAGVPSTATDVSHVSIAAGGSLVGLWVAEFLVLLGLLAAWRVMPQWLRETLKWAVLGAIGLLVLVGAVQTFGARGFALVAGCVPAGYLLEQWGLKIWAVSIGAVGVAVWVGATLGQLGVVAALTVLLLIAVLDAVAVASGAMQSVAGKAVGSWFAVMIYIPTRWRVDLSQFDDLEPEEKPEGIRSIIGAGDFGLPAMFVASTAVTLGSPVAGPVLAAAVGAGGGLAAAMSVTADSMQPGIPWIAVPTVALWAVAVFSTGTPVAVALGVI